MEDHGNQGRSDLSTRQRSRCRDPLRYGFAVSLSAACLLIILYLIGPPLMAPNDPEKSLHRLQKQKIHIQDEFRRVLDSFVHKHEALSATGWPENPKDRFDLLRSLCPEPELEGAAYYDEYVGGIELWYGKIIDINPIFEEAYNIDPLVLESRSILLIKYKSSVFLISYQELVSGAYVVFYRLLAYMPELKAQYLQDSHFLEKSYLVRSSIDYHDFREDISGTDDFFSRFNDEYIGQPQLQGDNQKIYYYFPLKNGKNRIVATVTLWSPSLLSRIASLKETLLLIFYLFLASAVVFLLLFTVRESNLGRIKRPWSAIFVISLLVGLRILAFPFSHLEMVRNLDIFSPAAAGFISFSGLSGSPADLFLTAVLLFLMLGYLTFVFRMNPKTQFRTMSRLLFILYQIGLGLAVLAAIRGLHEILSRMVLNSSFSLLHLEFHSSLILAQLSIFLLFGAFVLAAYTGFRVQAPQHPRYRDAVLGVLAAFFGYSLVFGEQIPATVLLLHGLLSLAILMAARMQQPRWHRRLQFLVFLIAVLMTFAIIQVAENQKNHSILEKSLKNIILSQEDWARFYIQQSIQEIEKDRGRIVTALRSPRIQGFARELWRETILAKSNWYSSLELFSSENRSLSRFSLNIPEMYRPDVQLPLSPDWKILNQTLSYWLKEKEFLIAYKDWFQEDSRVGRTVIMLSVDYETLPFLYSTNPYFELLRSASFPSLKELNLGFALFDKEGKLHFNPHNLASGIPSALLSDILDAESHIWSDFHDTDRSYQALMFPYKDKIYALFLPKKSVLKITVEFLKLLLVYSVCLAGAVILAYIFTSSKHSKGVLWSFSNRVYIAFVVIALIPLLLFMFSTQNFFSRIYGQMITEEAESRANFAHRVLEDYVYSQQEDQISLTIPPEELIIWISNTIAHDVNLYLDGRVYGTSHREFFEYGLLPDFIDGEIYYKIQYENNPLYTQTQKIGDYSFHTLTIPYYFQDNFLLISLPFPLEAQQISRTSADFFEFLFLLSAFFIVIVLLFGKAAGTTITSPIQKLLVGTKEVSLGNLEISITYEHEDEMKTLISGFNDMVTSLKKHQQELADLSKKVAWAEMARKVAHEIKNPLTPIQLSAEHLLRVYEERPQEFKKALEESTSYIVTEVEHLRRIAQQFLETSKEEILQKQTLDLQEILKETLEPYLNILSERIQFREYYTGENFQFLGDKDKIKIVLRNILTNAIESIQERGQIEVTLVSSGPDLNLEISDTGSGMDGEVLERIFEPYFSTKDVGTGLGLPIAKKIISDHGGAITARPNEPTGLRIRITLPRSES